MNDTDGLRRIGLKATVPRLRILELLRAGPERHLSAEDIHRRLLSLGLDVGLATVYRVLSQLEQAGIVSRSVFETGKAVFEIDEGSHHDHLICVQCGEVDEFYDPLIEKRQAAIAQERGFELQQHRLSLFGRCARCRAAHPAKD
ncbi:ferric iron uptake transcriptional regulator [Aquincola tertiaricarbonis]|uniref:ferric iron uptake transcriptional regulator n=1 Tax=Aquincola tertiaricarbonis TaxID=391953 RepID=UPI000614A3B8|nr:ferric iron uptake transcriptional regulator [Aquincola tertiaricarbonis]